MIIYLLKVLASSFVFWLIYRILLHTDTFFERNRFYLLLATMASFLLPLAAWQDLFAGNSTNLLFAQTQILQEIEIGQNLVYSEVSLIDILKWFAMGISTAYLLHVVFGIWQLFRLVKLNQKEKYPEYIQVNLENSQYPFSFMHFLFWGKRTVLSDKEKEKILQHEMAHIRGKHSVDLIFMEVVCGLCWFNPIFFLFKSYLKEQHEYIADAQVCKQSGKSDYARLMVQNTFNSLNMSMGTWQPKSIQLSHNFYQSPILKRIEMMNKTRTPIVKNLKLLVVLPAIAVLSLLYACESVESTENMVEEIVKKSDIDAASIKEESFDENEVYEIVNHDSEPVGGFEELYKYIGENLKYPNQAKRMGIEGKVYVQFIIDVDGTVTNVKPIRGIGAGCDAEAVRVLASSKKWSPAINADGDFVKQKMVLPINFKLN